ncbi:zinc ribbon domain-containing protein [Candidatus Poribacteria bacterium]|nr:zinc ribbon domain-containing protein [Candidatus Poribacteria bacterium]
MYVTAAAAAAYHSANSIMAATSRPVDNEARSSVQALETKLERQNLLIQTLLMILLEKKVVHDDEFREWMRYVDELDGARDGKLRENKAPVLCPACGRNNPPAAAKCQYCGAAIESDYLLRRPAE